MYDDELDMVLEDAYDDGYVQALLDMDADPDEIAEEDVDMFDDNYFDEAIEDVDMYDDYDYDYDEAMEGPAREYRKKMNAGKTPEEIRDKRKKTLNMLEDPRYSTKYFFDGRHVSAEDEHLFPGERKRHTKYRDKRVRRYDTDEGERMRDDVDRKYGEKAEKKVRDDYNARTRAQYDTLKSKLQSSDLTPAQKRAVMEKFKARKLEEKDDADYRAHIARLNASTRATKLRGKQFNSHWNDLLD